MNPDESGQAESRQVPIYRNARNGTGCIAYQGETLVRGAYEHGV